MKNEYEIPVPVIMEITENCRYQNRFMGLKKFLLEVIGIEIDSGVYAIENVVAKKLYIGSSAHLSKRIRSHINMLKKGIHHSAHLQRAWDNALPKSFNILILDVGDDKEYLLKREQYWMDYYHSYDDMNGYNISPTSSSSAGVKMSDEAKFKMSMARKGKRFSDEHRHKISVALKGRQFKPESIEQMRRSLTGKKLSEETKEKMRQSMIGKNTGKRSPETRAKMSAACKGRIANNRKLSKESVFEIKRLIAKGKSGYSIAKQFNIPKATVYQINLGRIYKDIYLEAINS